MRRRDCWLKSARLGLAAGFKLQPGSPRPHPRNTDNDIWAADRT